MAAQDPSDDVREITCFVIGPIGDRDGDPDSRERAVYEDAIQVFEEIIEPACRGFGIHPIRADRMSRAGEIPEQVFRALRDSHLVIADLTGGNPNVMYELGLRHTTGKRTLQICERERLPFDVSSIRSILFRRSDNGFVQARRQLASAIADVLERGGDPVAATRVWFEAAIGNEQSSQADLAERSSASCDTHDEPGYLEKLAELSEARDSLSLTLDSLTTVINEMTAMVSESTARARQINAAGGAASAKLANANALAAKLEEPASLLEVLSGDYRRSVERMHPGMLYIIAEAHEKNDEASSRFIDQTREFVASTNETWPAIRAYQKVLIEGGEAARSVRRVNRRIIAALNQQLDAERFFAEWKTALQ